MPSTIHSKCHSSTPRIANRLLRRVRDYAEVLGNGVLTQEIVSEALAKMGIDSLGLDGLDRRLLAAVIDYYNGGPVGLETLAAMLGEDAVTLEDVCEPYLMQSGFLTRTARGRCVTPMAYQHLGKPLPTDSQWQGSLFED